MTSIAEKRRIRDQLLMFVYSERDDRLGWLEEHLNRAIEAGMGSSFEVVDAFQVLERDGLMRVPVFGGPVIMLTSEGERRAEHLLAAQEAEELASASEASTVLLVADRQRIEAALTPLQVALDDGTLGLDEVGEQDARAILIVVTEHLRADRPRRKIVVGALSCLKAVGVTAAQGIGGNSAWAGLIELLRHLH